MYLVVLLVVGMAAYYLVFNKKSTNNSASNTQMPIDNTSSVPSSNTPTPAPVSAPAPSTNVTVNIHYPSFDPSPLNVKVGTKVTWINNDNFPHTVTSDSSDLLNSGSIAPGTSFSYTFIAPTTENYHCSIHPMMKGSVLVTN